MYPITIARRLRQYRALGRGKDKDLLLTGREVLDMIDEAGASVRAFDKVGWVGRWVGGRVDGHGEKIKKKRYKQ